MAKTKERMTPLEQTQAVLDISATERSTFKTCRRRWELEVLENLTPVTPPTLDREFGTGIHAALEGYYTAHANAPAYPEKFAGKNHLKSALYSFDEWWDKMDEQLSKDHSLPAETRQLALDTLVALGDLGEEILRGYRQYAKLEDHFTVHAIEGRLTPAGESWLKKHAAEREHLAEHSASAVVRHETGRLLVPILNPKTQKPLKRGPMLSCRLDLMVNRIDEGMKGLWIYDHKTTGRMPNDRGLDFDDQVTAYCYAVWRWLGIVPRGVCFNYLIKQVPKEPRILQKGQLSTAKDQLTTAKLYRQALIDQGLMLKDGSVTSPAHAEAYEALLSRGWEPFFQRQYVGRNRQELVSFERRLFEEYEDMLDAERGDLPLYPNHSRMWCPSCSVAPICQAMEDGSDVEGIIETRYEQAPDRKAA